MAKLIMTKGLPGSGKSTWVKEFIANNPNWKRVNKDDLREMIDASVWNKKNEDMILKARNSLIELWLNNGYNVICDDTNFAEKHETELRKLADSCHAVFEVNDSFINVPLSVCIERDSKRSKSVGEKVIRKMYKDYLWKFPERKDYKWLDTLEANSKVNRYMTDAIIVDLDGTLALHDGRNPYDGDKCDTDIVNPPLKWILECLGFLRHKIIYVSGRDSKYRDKTEEWIENNIASDERVELTLYMRPEGDKRPDTEIKQEIYENEIKGRYNVVAVFDDRKAVVSMWRSLGLFVFDCNQFAGTERGDY